MRCVALLLLSSIACGPAVEVVRPPRVAETPQALVEPPPAPRARATRCVAQPSTVYGEEEVVFRVDGDGDPHASAETELRDERDRTILKGAVTVPGELRQPDLPSGDFVLIVGADGIRCAVTVNRELQRASSRER